jgi:hypothetical protein
MASRLSRSCSIALSSIDGRIFADVPLPQGARQGRNVFIDALS